VVARVSLLKAARSKAEAKAKLKQREMDLAAETYQIGEDARVAEVQRVREFEQELRDRFKDKPLRILVIGDSHAVPGVPNDRFSWLYSMISEMKPNVVVDIGDWFSMDSLCSFDKGQRCFEGRRVWKDIDVGKDAMERIRCKGPVYVRCLGNHENRITRIGELEPAFDGLVSLDDLGSDEYGWEQVPFLEPVEIGGVAFVHYLKGKGSRAAVAGVVPARSAFLGGHHSIVVGHSHTMSYFESVGITGRRYCSMNVGCYTPEHMAYASTDNRLFRRGIALLERVKDGTFSPRWYGIDEVEERWG